jgi:cell division protein FtsL
MAKKQTFAERAKAIQSKYKKRLGEDFQKDDYLARQAMNMELQKLKEEQESVRKNMGVQEAARHVLANKDDYSPTTVKRANFAHNASKWNKKRFGGGLPKYQEPNKENNYGNLERLDLIPFGGIDIPEINMDLRESKESKESKESLDEYNPTISVLPLAASVIGNAYSGLTAKDRAVSPEYERMSPEEISLASERESIRRRSEATKNTVSRQARGLGLSGGAATTRGIIGLTEADRVAGEALSRSYMQEELANAQARERARRFNLGLGAREEDMRLSEEIRTQELQDQAIQNILQSVSGYATDVNRARTYADITNAMSPEYAMYEDPEQSLVNKLLLGSRRTFGYRDK